MTFQSVVGKCIMLALLLFVTGSSSAQWVRDESLPASDIPSLILRGSTMYAGTDSAVFISTNVGNGWTRTATLPGSPWFVDALAFLDGTLFAGTGGNGVFVSSNDGQNWMSLNQGLVGLGSRQISSFAVRNGVLYVGTQGAGVFQLQQNNWYAFGDLSGQAAGTVTFLDIKGDTLVAGAGGNGYIWYASGGATSWSGVLVAPLQSEPLQVQSLAAFGEAFYIGTFYGVYRSTDDGASWIPASVGIPAGRIVKLIAEGDTLYASATGAVTDWYRSIDGLQWTFVEQTPLVYAHVVYANTLYAGRIDGLWYKQLLPTSAEQSHHIPQRLALEQNSPNPFNPSTTINYQLPNLSHVTLRVFDVLGREVATLVNGVEEAGYKSVAFDASKLSTGVYYYCLQVRDHIEMKKLLLLR